MSDTELQEEEKEVLLSIYDGDPAFNMTSPTTYQYKYGSETDGKTFLIEIVWGETYPTEKPTFNLDLFYNKHLTNGVKSHIISTLNTECEQYLGCAMTYTVFEYVRDNIESLLSDAPEQEVSQIENSVQDLDLDEDDPNKKEKVKKEILSKAQKRKQWERTDGKGEKPRGWNWVDIVKHLAQTGGKNES